MDAPKNGLFSWNELMSTDVEASRKFYSELLGWTAKEMPMPTGTYYVFHAGEQQAAGLMAMPPQAKGIPTYWGSYVTVADVDALTAQAARMGARILVPPMDVPGVGRFSTFQDPQGGVLSVITYSPRTG